MNYQLAITETTAAKNLSNYASVKVDLCKIRERLAEIENQHEPLNKLTDGDRATRDKCWRAAFYVVIGRWPA